MGDFYSNLFRRRQNGDWLGALSDLFGGFFNSFNQSDPFDPETGEEWSLDQPLYKLSPINSSLRDFGQRGNDFLNQPAPLLDNIMKTGGGEDFSWLEALQMLPLLLMTNPKSGKIAGPKDEFQEYDPRGPINPSFQDRLNIQRAWEGNPRQSGVGYGPGLIDPEVAWRLFIQGKFKPRTQTPSLLSSMKELRNQ